MKTYTLEQLPPNHLCTDFGQMLPGTVFFVEYEGGKFAKEVFDHTCELSIQGIEMYIQGQSIRLLSFTEDYLVEKAWGVLSPKSTIQGYYLGNAIITSKGSKWWLRIEPENTDPVELCLEIATPAEFDFIISKLGIEKQ